MLFWIPVTCIITVNAESTKHGQHLLNTCLNWDGLLIECMCACVYPEAWCIETMCAIALYIMHNHNVQICMPGSVLHSLVTYLSPMTIWESDVYLCTEWMSYSSVLIALLEWTSCITWETTGLENWCMHYKLAVIGDTVNKTNELLQKNWTNEVEAFYSPLIPRIKICCQVKKSASRCFECSCGALCCAWGKIL